MTDEIVENAMNLWAEGKEDEAIDLLSPFVEGGNVVAKANLGLLFCHYFRDNGFNKLREGERLLVEACEAGEASACHNLGTLWLGDPPSLGKDIRKAALYYLKARELGGPVAEAEFYEKWEQVLDDQHS